MDKLTARLAIQLIAEYAADYEAYLADRDSYYSADGRTKYRAHYCEHGTNLWTDYDNICGGCEDGVTMGDPMQRRERALYEAKRRVKEADELFAFMSEAVRLNLTYAIEMGEIKARIRGLLQVA